MYSNLCVDTCRDIFHFLIPQLQHGLSPHCLQYDWTAARELMQDWQVLNLSLLPFPSTHLSEKIFIQWHLTHRSCWKLGANLLQPVIPSVNFCEQCYHPAALGYTCSFLLQMFALLNDNKDRAECREMALSCFNQPCGILWRWRELIEAEWQRSSLATLFAISDQPSLTQQGLKKRTEALFLASTTSHLKNSEAVLT